MGTIMLSPQEVQDIERMCSDPFLELGMTLRPRHLECLKDHVATNDIRLSIQFKKHEDAQKWNNMHETRIRKSGHMATIALISLVGLITRNYGASVVLGSSTGILKDEIQAKIWYPKVFEGWILTRNYNLRYDQFPSQNFCMSWADEIKDQNEQVVEQRNHGMSCCEVGGPFGIPEKIVRQLISLYPVQTMTYK